MSAKPGAAQPAALNATKPAPAPAPAKTAATVLVASKFQHPLNFEITDSAGKPVVVTINGNAGHLKGKPKGILPAGKDAFALTPTDAGAWEKIKAKYAKMPAIANGILFVASGAEEAAERGGVASGFEPVDPAKTNSQPK